MIIAGRAGGDAYGKVDLIRWFHDVREKGRQ